MTNNPITFHAEWWAPDGVRRFSGERHTGTLSYNQGEGITLKVYHRPSKGIIYSSYKYYDVLWGESADGHIFTLFNVVLVHQQGFTSSEFTVDYVLLDFHVGSLEDPLFNCCVTNYPFLREWAFEQRISQEQDNDIELFKFNMGQKEPLFSSEIEKGIIAYGLGQLSYHKERFDLTAEQRTNYCIESEKKCSIKQLLSLVSEFSEFLSIALFCPQHPIEVKFRDNGDGLYHSLLFKSIPSTRPMHVGLIKYDLLKEKMPSLLTEWHINHEQAAPIATYLIRSMRLDTPFDSPDFLIIAEALDGYFKRFENKKKGKDYKKYKEGIDKLLEMFNDVEVIKKINIDSATIEACRNKYSHLYPDEEDNNNVVKGFDLYYLTQKCKILLTCCILKLLGLNNAEINTCCNNSPISYIIDALPVGV